MTIRAIAMAMGLFAASVVGAVNDPDSTDRAVKYLDAMNSAIVSFYTPNSQCFQFAPNVPPPTTPIACVSLSGGGSYEALPATNVGEIVVLANESRSLLTLNMQPVADYLLTNTSAARTSLILNAVVRVSIESTVLNDPTLINPRTGQPFGGKIEANYQWFFDRRMVDASETFEVANKMPFEANILSRKILTSVYGLSPTRAALVFARPMTVKVGIGGNLMGSGRATFFMSGRLFGD